jgi:tetratricopeptide (TPR) repeat protein
MRRIYAIILGMSFLCCFFYLAYSKEVPQSEKKEVVSENFTPEDIKSSQFRLQASFIIAEIREKLKENPDDKKLWTSLAFIADYCGYWYISIEANKKLIKLGINDSAVYHNLGRAYMNLGNLDTAEKYLKKSLQVQPDNFFAFWSLGLLFKYKKDYKKSIEYFKNAVGTSANSPALHSDFGNTYLVMGDYDNAIKCYEKAMELGLKDAEIFKSMGFAYLGKENKKKALNCFKKALKLSPQNQSIKELIKVTQDAIKKKEKLNISSE